MREFTDEEERQRDAEEAEWEAQRPQRELEARRREEEANRFRESLQYEERIVAFLDVLGWKEAIKASMNSREITQRLGVALQGLGAQVQMNSWQRTHGGPDGWPGDPMITHFSDSLLISFSAGVDAKFSLETTLSTVILGMMFNGFVVRGAVCYGQLIHRDFVAYGPGLVDASALEKSHANVPRIILDPTLAGVWGEGLRVENQDGSLIGYHKTWRRDDDGWFFYDYLADQHRLPGMGGGQSNPSYKAVMEKWRNLILRRLGEHADSPSVLPKYIWLANYFNAVCGESAAEKIEPIAVPARA